MTMVLLGVLILAGCGSGASTTPEPAPSASAGVEPTLVPGAVTQPPAGSGVEVTARNVAFEPTELVVPAGPAELTFHNDDAGIPHNVAISDAGGSQLLQGDLVVGPEDVTYVLPDLAPGAYTFTCTVHPNMTGTITIVP